MNLSLAVKTCLFKDCFTMNRRAFRSEYWWFVLFGFIAGLVLGILSIIPIIGTLVYAVADIWIWLASLTVSVRRLHDDNHTGWWLVFPYLWAIGGGIFLLFTIGGAMSSVSAGDTSPSNLFAGTGIIGTVCLCASAISFLLLFIYFILPGTKGENKFGPDPLVDK
ncbi:MAG: DUF805 domain-containing protein [Aeromonadales bacterium]|nr:DUF805 domain-containing protein [Aeromonadales bacterium]